MRALPLILTATLTTGVLGCSETEREGTGNFGADVWADNWFAMYADDELVAEDSVSITTERSFNSESFNFDAEYPFTLNVVIKDFKENDTGLEYIGQPNQQMGDGGFIAQVVDNETGDVVMTSSSAWSCLVIHAAPLDKSCEKDANPEATCTFDSQAEPTDWKGADFDTSGWQGATEYTEAAVSPKDGYDEIDWDAAAQLIWTSDLETDNTLLCRVTIDAP